jgi:hypothetical protein
MGRRVGVPDVAVVVIGTSILVYGVFVGRILATGLLVGLVVFLRLVHRVAVALERTATVLEDHPRVEGPPPADNVEGP